MRARREEGVAVVLVLALVGGLLSLAAAAVGLSAVVVVHRKVQAAADLAAIAAARSEQDGADPCGAARDVAEENGAEVSVCDVAGSEVTVTVVTRLPAALGDRELRARARAGPSGGD